MNDPKKSIRKSFLSFYIQAFSTINPGSKLIDLPFQRYICDQYQNLKQGDRLVVNQPPRTGKSLTAVAYAVYRIALNPTEKIVILSNITQLSEEHVYIARKIMRKRWFRETFPATEIANDRSALTHLQTTQGGGFFAGSMRSSLGGVPATTIIIDDGNRIDDEFRRFRASK